MTRVDVPQMDEHRPRCCMLHVLYILVKNK